MFENSKTKARLTEALAEADGILSRAEAEGRDLDDDERTEYDALLARVDRLTKKADIEAAIDSGRARLEPATGPLPVRGAARRSDPWDGFDRCGGLNGLDTNQGLRTRAADAVEGFDLPDPARQRLAEMLDRDRTTESAQFVLAAGNPAYARAFDLWLRDPVSAAMSCTPEELAAWREVTGLRTALTLTGGAAMLPLTLDPAVLVTNTGVAGDVRRYATVRQTATDRWRGAKSPGVTAEFKVEGAEAADATPTLSAIDVAVHQGFASIMASYELFDDSDIGSQLGALIADARQRQESTVLVTGTGSGEPFGCVTRVAATTASRVAATTASTFSAMSEVFRVRDAVPVRHRQGRAVWLANIATLSSIQQFATSSASADFWGPATASTPATLLGHPVVECSTMDSATTTGSNLLALVNLADYFLVDRLGTSVEIHNVHGSAGGRSTGQREVVARWRYGADLGNTDAGRVLRL